MLDVYESLGSFQLVHTFCGVIILSLYYMSLLCYDVMKNTTNPDNAYYELFALPKDPDPSNPECKCLVYMYILALLQLVVYHRKLFV